MWPPPLDARHPPHTCANGRRDGPAPAGCGPVPVTCPTPGAGSGDMCVNWITDYIVSLGFDVENATKAEIDRLCRGQPLGGGLEGEGEERRADGHKGQPE